jgi:uncharacterized delta-60 repeat protein
MNIIMKQTIFTLTTTFFLYVNTFAQIGSIDPDFNPGTGFGPDQWTGKCETIVQQPDGKLLVGGQFETFNDEEVIYITRLNKDGTRDLSFSSPLEDGWGNLVIVIELQSDGKILIGGNFRQTGEQSQLGIARLNTDGSFDQDFIPPAGIQNVSTLAIQPDGKIVLGNLIRLNADGSIDDTFNAGTGIGGGQGFGGVRVNTVAVQPDGKILIGGHFGSYNETQSILLARLNSDGTLDESFNANANFSQAIDGFYGQVYAIKLLPDGKIMIGGNYGNTNSTAFGVDRLNSDGSLDTTFQITHSTEIRNYTLDIQPDGKVLAANVNFGAPSEAFVVERYNTDGSLDETFPKKYVNRDVKDLIVQKDGNVTFVGYFDYNPIGIMRLIGDAPVSTITSGKPVFNFNVYPNPAGKFITVTHVPAASSLVISDITGKVVYHAHTQNEQKTTINTSNFPDGIYLVRMLKNGTAVTKKLVVKN